MQKNILKFTQHHVPILPVIKLSNADDVIPLAQALRRGGITSLEITLRSNIAIEAIKLAIQELPDFCISAGTVISTKQVETLAKVGVDFMVTPGISVSLLDAAKANNVDILPGVNGSSDVMLGMEYELTYFKLFPATIVGGVPMLKALGGPFSDVKFCPTGGLTLNNFMEFYQLENVFAFGGSWMVTPSLLSEKKWYKVEELTREMIDQLI